MWIDCFCLSWKTATLVWKFRHEDRVSISNFEPEFTERNVCLLITDGDALISIIFKSLLSPSILTNQKFRTGREMWLNQFDRKEKSSLNKNQSEVSSVFSASFYCKMLKCSLTKTDIYLKEEVILQHPLHRDHQQIPERELPVVCSLWTLLKDETMFKKEKKRKKKQSQLFRHIFISNRLFEMSCNCSRCPPGGALCQQ